MLLRSMNSSKNGMLETSPDRTPGILAALDYLGIDVGTIRVIGRTNHAVPKRKPDRWKSIVAAFKLRFS